MEVRRRIITEPDAKPQEFLESFDIFPKLPKECKRMTATGGVVSIITLLFLALLLVSELYAFWHSKFIYTYEVDDDVSSKIQINIDITVATRCEYTSLDVLDLTGADQPTEGTITYDKTHFQLNNAELKEFNDKKMISNVLREHPLVLHEMMWRRHHFHNLRRHSQFKATASGQEEARPAEQQPNPLPYDACRMHGSLRVKKVMGNMHIISGKPLGDIGRLHVHLSIQPKDTVLNFSHRINHLSFGPRIGDTLEPLEGVEMIANSLRDSFQYTVTIVPTRIAGTFYSSDTFQYAARVKNQTIDHSKGVHGSPGIMLYYDTFPLRVKVTEHRELVTTFLARMAAVVGGLFAFVDLFRQASCGIPDLVWHSRAARGFRQRWLTSRANSCPGGVPLSAATPCPLDPDSDT